MSLTPQQIEQKSCFIAQKVMTCLQESDEYIHIFLPIVAKNEVNTYPLIEQLVLRGKKIVVSQSQWKKRSMVHYIYDSQKIKINQVGIPEPFNSVKVPIQKLDIVIVPLLISDKRGYRIGYGKGFYDRFLAKCPTQIQIIGINFFPPVDFITDIQSHDIPIRYLVTPSKVFNFKNEKA